MTSLRSMLRGRPASAGSEARPAGDGLDDALDTLAFVLRTFGRGVPVGPGTGDAIAACDGWARHLLTGGPAPGASGPADARSIPVHERSFSGARQAFAALRAAETSHVHALGDALRGGVLDLLGAVRHAVAEGRGLDDALERDVARLADALGTDDPVALRASAREVAAGLEAGLRRRRALQAEVVRGLGRRLRGLREELREATRAAERDALTGLANRAALDRRMEATVGMAAFTGQPECLVLLDVDHFKRVNDGHGHRGGDAVLAALGEALARAIVRRSDLVARFGGEEFAILLADTDAASGTRVVERVLREVRGLVVPHEGADLRVTASAGLAELRAGGTVESWLQEADTALYMAKAAGRDRLVVAGAPPTGTSAPAA